MFWRERRVRRDRAAGMVFDWRRGHGSTPRLFFAIVVSACFWGGVLAYVRVREPAPSELDEDQVDLTLVDLGDDRNQWLAALIDRETLFQQRWRVEDPTAAEREVARLMAEDSPRQYHPVLREIPRPTATVPLSNLPGREAEVLPPPGQVVSVSLALPPENWWIEVTMVDGPEGFEPLFFPFSWPVDPGLMSEGDVWFVVATVDEEGIVVSIDGSGAKAGDPRTPAILEEIRARGLAGLAGGEGIRIWRLQARVVNRPVSK